MNLQMNLSVKLDVFPFFNTRVFRQDRTSMNNEVVYGIPGLRKLVNGDIISIDVGAFYKGYCGDVARTFPAGDISPEAERPLEVTKQLYMWG